MDLLIAIQPVPISIGVKGEKMDTQGLAKEWADQVTRFGNQPPGMPSGMPLFLAATLENGELIGFYNGALSAPDLETYVGDWVAAYNGPDIWLPGIANGLAKQFFVQAFNDGSLRELISSYLGLTL